MTQCAWLWRKYTADSPSNEHGDQDTYLLALALISLLFILNFPNIPKLVEVVFLFFFFFFFVCFWLCMAKVTSPEVVVLEFSAVLFYPNHTADLHPLCMTKMTVSTGK